MVNGANQIVPLFITMPAMDTSRAYSNEKKRSRSKLKRNQSKILRTKHKENLKVQPSNLNKEAHNKWNIPWN